MEGGNSIPLPTQEKTMKFMMIVKANKESESSVMPSAKELEEMGKYNEELVNAGVMLAGEGLHASSKGFRVQYSNQGAKVVDGPFAESKELVAGFWIIQVRSREEAIQWAKKIPFREGEVEVRQVAETEDFAAVDPTGEIRRKEEELRKRIEARA